MYKTHKIALNPNNKQRRWFSQQCGYARFAYNHALSDFKSEIAKDNFLSASKLDKRFNTAKKKYAWTKDMDQRASQKSIYQNLGAAIKNWTDKRAKFPKFKKRGKRDSYTTDEQSVSVKDKRIKLPKIGWVNMFESLRFVGKIMKVTVSRTAHRWFVSITVDTTEAPKAVELSTHSVVGIDVGINTLATLSDGTQYDNPRPLKRYERKLKRANRRFSKKKHKSKNWYKQKQKIARIHYKIACIRGDAHHKATTDIVNTASVIGIETLKVTNMLKNKKLAKALSDSAFGGFLSKLKTKSVSRGIPVVEADQFYASSKTCSSCGHKKKGLQLKDRIYNCSECGISIDRDVNAAINLKHVAVGHTETKNACGVHVETSNKFRTEFRKEAVNDETGKVNWIQLGLFPV